MNAAVIGSGGREHALLWKLSKSKRIDELYAIPGNGGAARIAHQVTVGSGSVDDLVIALRPLNVDLVVVGPEQPLADGLADRLISQNVTCFGPSAGAARLEASKVFSKELMREAGIPTAAFQIFEDFSKLEKFVHQNPRVGGWVVKADGLAAGKGAFVCAGVDDTLAASKSLLIDGILGDAGQRVVLEERLHGTEASAHYWCDGERFAPLPAARDYKRAFDSDEGPNTGGMGTYCPAGHVTKAILSIVNQSVVEPTLRTLSDQGSPYRGLLYVGLMLTDDGPKVIEYNCRFGDPETQVILPVIDYDIADVMLSCANGKLNPSEIDCDPKCSAVSVVLAANGYPGSYSKSIPLASIPDTEDCITFHAGTKIDDNKLLSTGGRVLNAVGLGKDLRTAREHAYKLAERLRVPGLRYRSDIAAGLENS